MVVSRESRFSLGAAFLILGLLLGAIAVIPAATAAANQGTIKVSDDSACATGIENNPKVTSPFYIGGTGFDPNEDFSLTFETQPGGDEALTVTGSTDENGAFCLGPLALPEGKYKVTYTDPSGNKSKVFDVGVSPTTPPTTTPPTTTPPTTTSPTTTPPTTEPPTTTSPTTTPPTTTPPTTTPPTTTSPTTTPPTTEPPTTTSPTTTSPTTGDGGGGGGATVASDGPTSDTGVAGVKLADTGANVNTVGLLALVLVTLGAALLATSRRSVQRH